jgi:predicted HTH domain antitoxin
MSQGTLVLPESVSENEAKLFLAMKLFEVGRMSCGQAAEFAGYSKRTFMEVLGKHGIPAFDYDSGELTDDLDHA